MIVHRFARATTSGALLAASLFGCQSQTHTPGSTGQPDAAVASAIAAPDPDRTVLASASHTDAADEIHVTKSMVVDWSRRGVKDQEIVERIERSREVFRLTAADETQLRDLGVSETVIQAMEDTARR